MSSPVRGQDVTSRTLTGDYILERALLRRITVLYLFFQYCFVSDSTKLVTRSYKWTRKELVCPFHDPFLPRQRACSSPFLFLAQAIGAHLCFFLFHYLSPANYACFVLPVPIKPFSTRFLLQHAKLLHLSFRYRLGFSGHFSRVPNNFLIRWLFPRVDQPFLDMTKAKMFMEYLVKRKTRRRVIFFSRIFQFHIKNI